MITFQGLVIVVSTSIQATFKLTLVVQSLFKTLSKLAIVYKLYHNIMVGNFMGYCFRF